PVSQSAEPDPADRHHHPALRHQQQQRAGHRRGAGTAVATDRCAADWFQRRLHRPDLLEHRAERHRRQRPAHRRAEVFLRRPRQLHVARRGQRRRELQLDLRLPLEDALQQRLATAGHLPDEPQLLRRHRAEPHGRAAGLGRGARPLGRGRVRQQPVQPPLRVRRGQYRRAGVRHALRQHHAAAHLGRGIAREVLNMPPSDGLPEIHAILQRMRDTQARDPLPDWPVRAARLRKLESLLQDQRAAIAAAIHADFGNRPAEETDLLEVFPSLSAVRHALRHGQRWMRPRRRLADLLFLPARTELRPQPLGVVGIIVPWNYPLYLAVGPLVDALAAGNRVMLKMSEYTPHFSTLFAALVARHFEPEEVVVANGDAAVGQAFAALPFDHLLFTGSTAVGHHVMRAAAANLTPVTLELGGKSPAIVGPGARLEHAAERIMFGKLVNAGQTCIAPDYVLLPRARMGEFIDAARAATARLYPDLARNPQYASTATDRHYARLSVLRDEAHAAGATVEALSDAAPDPTRRLLPPVLLTNVHDDMAVMREEIFGPLLPVVPYDTLDE